MEIGMIAVVGGCYAEICFVPRWDHIYGSAGRAAAALSSLTRVDLYTLLSSQFRTDFHLAMSVYDVTHHFVPQDCAVTFQYLHPLASPYRFIDGQLPESGSLPHVRSENILVFGMVEYDPVVHGSRVVYDPQSDKPKLFSQSGSTAGELVYVLNALELEKITDLADVGDAAALLLRTESALAIVVKKGPFGATVFSSDGEVTDIPCYRARRVFKIGSGDIFAAAFAYFWQVGAESLANAADLASRAVACYVETQDAFIPDKIDLIRDFNQRVTTPPGLVYLAAPFFSLEQRWLLEETKALLESFGCRVFSPLHVVGTGRPNIETATEDLAGLQECKAVLALLNDNDTGTIFEVGYGTAIGKVTVVYAERNSSRDLVMLDGSGALIFPDYCSAVYNAVWESGGS
jgi:hypothetical protein